MSIFFSLTYTFRIMKQCFLVCKYRPALLVFPFVSFFLYFVVEAILWILFYLRYGLHMFNADTLELWALISLWELSFFLIFFAAPFYFLVSIMFLFSEVCIAHFLFAKTTIASTFRYTISCLPRLIVHAWARTLVILGGETGIRQFLRERAEEVGVADFFIRPKSDDWMSANFLVVPIIAQSDSSIKSAFRESMRLMQHTFGDHAKARFSFGQVLIFSVISICFVTEKIVSGIWNEAVGAAVIVLILGLLITIVNTVSTIFHIAVFQYCNNQPTIIPREMVQNSFEKR